MNLTGFYFLFRHNLYENIYKRLEGTTLDCINSILKTNSKIHNRSTRFLNLNFHCPVYYKNTAGHTFSMSTIIRNWNELSADVKRVKNVKSFKVITFSNY